jgi:hypothetical protein
MIAVAMYYIFNQHELSSRFLIRECILARVTRIAVSLRMYM